MDTIMTIHVIYMNTLRALYEIMGIVDSCSIKIKSVYLLKH